PPYPTAFPTRRSSDLALRRIALEPVGDLRVLAEDREGAFRRQPVLDGRRRGRRSGGRGERERAHEHGEETARHSLRLVEGLATPDRKSTRLNSSHVAI